MKGNVVPRADTKLNFIIECPHEGLCNVTPAKSREWRETNQMELRVMMVIDKSGIVHFVANKAEAARKAQEAREAQK